MFSREESKKVREEFWIQFGKEYPRKWILYNTKIKEVQLKFTFSNEVAQVSIDVYSVDKVIQEYYTEKFRALETVLKEEYLPEAMLDESYLLPEGKIVTRIYVELSEVNIHNRKHWSIVAEFLSRNMMKMESFFEDFESYIRD